MARKEKQAYLPTAPGRNDPGAPLEEQYRFTVHGSRFLVEKQASHFEIMFKIIIDSKSAPVYIMNESS